ncbi:MAG: hypothetical protein U9Q04_01595 [Campylobacterota bacterium]|nr:hypothetical protein [Campylobacterota bacterium]
MITNQKFKGIIDKLNNNFKSAEARIKNAELLNQNLSIPSINELRYAGHHLLKATQESDESIILEELDKADRHTKRSYYDAIEASLLYKLQEIQQFDETYKVIPETLDVINDYNSKISKVSNIVEEIQKIDTKTREEKYIKIDEYYKVIKETNNEFQMSINTIVTLIDKNELNQQKEHRKFILQLIVGIIAIIVAVAIAFK